MFQDTLLIIKFDYIHRRKSLLIYLLQRGFQIQGRRKIVFSPELAAEFYQDMSDDPCFMFQVILLSKGNSEAFILAKENAVEDLINSMVCYFGSSTEMDRNVHVTRCLGKVRKDISFIFPNYIFEPIYCPEQLKFCSNNPFVTSLIHEVYDITTTPERDPHKSWKEKLADWLIFSNKNLPNVSNQCSHNPSMNVREIAQQTKVTTFKHVHDFPKASGGSKSLDMGFSTDGTSLNVTSSSCVTCSDFGSEDECIAQQKQTMVDIIKAKTAPLTIVESSSSRSKDLKSIHEEHDEAKEPLEEAENVEAEAIFVLDTLDAAVGMGSTIPNYNQPLSVKPKLEEAGAGDASTGVDGKSVVIAPHELEDDVPIAIEKKTLDEHGDFNENQSTIEIPSAEAAVEIMLSHQLENETPQPEQIETETITATTVDGLDEVEKEE